MNRNDKIQSIDSKCQKLADTATRKKMFGKYNIDEGSEEAETYKNGVTIHSLVKKEDETTKTIFCEIASNIAMMLEKDTGKAITQKDGLTVALNFNPVPVKHNMVRTFHLNDTEERLFN